MCWQRARESANAEKIINKKKKKFLLIFFVVAATTHIYNGEKKGFFPFDKGQVTGSKK